MGRSCRNITSDTVFGVSITKVVVWIHPYTPFLHWMSTPSRALAFEQAKSISGPGLYSLTLTFSATLCKTTSHCRLAIFTAQHGLMTTTFYTSNQTFCVLLPCSARSAPTAAAHTRLLSYVLAHQSAFLLTKGHIRNSRMFCPHHVSVQIDGQQPRHL